MNRREFLKSLAALGASFAIPARALASAPEEAIDAAWEQALAEPHFFYVRDECSSIRDGYSYTLTTTPSNKAEIKEMIEAFGAEGEDVTPRNCCTGQGCALSFFDRFEYNEALNIRIVEGDCPGSSYFAAELCTTVEEANRIAADLRLPIRFAQQDP